jgi:intracellular multiplication protein IcmB
VLNSLGPIELWALSTTPGDTALRNRLYERVGFSEGLRRLARVFPAGSAMKEIERRTDERLSRGEMATQAEEGVIDVLASELVDGHGIGMKLRDSERADSALDVVT